MDEIKKLMGDLSKAYSTIERISMLMETLQTEDDVEFEDEEIEREFIDKVLVLVKESRHKAVKKSLEILEQMEMKLELL